MASVLFMGQKVIFNALFASIYLQQGHPQFRDDLDSLANSLESGAYCLDNDSGVGMRSKEIIYSSLADYLGRKVTDDKECAIELSIIVDDLRNPEMLNERGTIELSRFCKIFHDYALNSRKEVLPEVEKILGPLD